MDDIIAELAEQHAELSGLLAGLDESEWQRPSPPVAAPVFYRISVTN